MMSSSPDTPTRSTGTHRAHREARDRAAARTLVQRPPARYEPYLDGLFTYCLSVLCDHDTATAALGDVLALAERRSPRGPESAGDRRAWLYALARWACLRKLAEAKQKRQSTHAAGRRGKRQASAVPAPQAAPDSAASAASASSSGGCVSEEAQEAHRRELAQLAWPEAAGTTPEQREALELAVRHKLDAHEVAAVLGLDAAAAGDLLASAACEVERTRAALAVVETGACPSVSRLTGDHQLVLSTALRRELVRHVDDCPRCRRTAERAVPGSWPGTSVTPAELPVLEAPRAALHVAMAHLPRARGTAAPRFDRRGFPMDPKDRAARRDRLRARAVTTTVVATVVAAPVLALWAAYRGAPVTGEGGPGDRSATASEAQRHDILDGEAAGGGYENAGNAGNAGTGADRGLVRKDHGSPDVSVEVVSAVPGAKESPGHLTVEASSDGDTTLITLTASGHTPVRWTASTGASWLYPSRSSGTLRPGESFTIKVYVDPLREPSGHWSARVSIAPASAVVSIEGYGTAPTPPDPTPVNPPAPGPPRPSTPPPDPDPTTSAPATPPPSDPPPSSSPDPEPTPTPTPTASVTSTPADPGGSSPPADSGSPSPVATP
ncbi:BACON domain-containing protein [Streptomyces sp. SID12501]|uniref:BACON domain-containing protein n=1 Tax=Streptomyces sp. SID12501 TaxID=2706042 RepID=A0A6B3C4L2_9ACTN|nr:BACON domain-containing protein [Streptomyces sp. SID12501]